jgi:integrase
MKGKSIPMSDIRGYLTFDEIKRLFSVIDNERDELLFKLMYYCGRRVSEVLNLKVRDIDFNESTIIFDLMKKRSSKGGKLAARVVVKKELIEKLKKYIEKNNIKTKIFTITRQQVFNLMRKYCWLAEIDRIGSKKPHPHHLRHSFAVHWIKKGGNLQTLKNILGHTSLEVTSFYLQFSLSDIKKEYDKVFS